MNGDVGLPVLEILAVLGVLTSTAEPGTHFGHAVLVVCQGRITLLGVALLGAPASLPA